MENLYGYACVSTREQNEDRQLIAMREMGVPPSNIYMDKQSGKDFNRSSYKKLLRKLKKTICSMLRASIVWAEIMGKFKICGGKLSKSVEIFHFTFICWAIACQNPLY